jgi:hypothetical protein
MEINKKFTIIVPIILLSIILGHVMWATAQAASSPDEMISGKAMAEKNKDTYMAYFE